MCEDVARTVHIAREHSPVTSLEDEHVDALHQRYQHVYGQRPQQAGNGRNP